MPTEQLSVGLTYTLVQNTVYALPAKACSLFSNVDLELSNTSAFSTNGTVASNTTTKVAAPFVRCTSSAAIVTVKPD